jgi:hypothetical protein
VRRKERGTIRVHAVDANGRGTADDDWNVTWAADRPGSGDCGAMVGIVIPDDGRFELPCPSGGSTIAGQEWEDSPAGWANIGSGHVVVFEGTSADIEISGTPLTSHHKHTRAGRREPDRPFARLERT